MGASPFSPTGEKVPAGRMRGRAQRAQGLFEGRCRGRPSPFIPLPGGGEGERRQRLARKIAPTYPRPPLPPAYSSAIPGLGRRELSHSRPGMSGACPGEGADTPERWQGGADRSEGTTRPTGVPPRLETGSRGSGKTPRAGCRRCHASHYRLPASAGIPHTLPIPPGGSAVAPRPCVPVCPSGVTGGFQGETCAPHPVIGAA